MVGPVENLARKVEPVTLRRYDDGHVRVLEAPPLASFALEILQGADDGLLRVDVAGYLELGGEVVYRPVSFVREPSGVLALICERVR